ncbi:copper-containing nitrite reductase [Caldimonas brevitalea]|uniref:Copper-containing nitrite reductase n=1 Tax=Caldimonas brevitalea TaxID=413882 RepID=A0A0G3BN44_9BURK|nr:copper-containing nitrite reductase [Caldimonas brevitalea]AKJ30874.1 nitrite reductase [Caldimonas brevitalea]
MFARVLAPIPFAIAVFVGAAMAGPLTSVAQAAPATAQKEVVRQYTLSTGMADGKMVYLDAQGKASNPVLKANVGDTVVLTIGSGEGAQHDIVIPDLKVASKKFDSSTGSVTVRFKASKPGRFTYYCSIPGHQQIGMEGVLEVAATSASPAAAAPASKAAVAAAAGPALALAPAAADAVSITMDPNSVPPAIGKRAPTLVKYRIDTVELNGKLDDGTTFNYWTFGSKVPGPMLRVKQGDTVEMTLANHKSSKMVHSIDLHSVTGGHGGGADTQVAPGQEKTIRFKALNPGLYVYHCATPSVPHHISAGMYGLILVEPEEGLPPVDREYYVMQGDLYTGRAAGTKGHHEYSPERASDELPSFYTFNGAVGSLTKEFKMTAKVGETVRVYFGVGGPNKVSSFHVIGEIFDKVYSEGSVSSVKKDVQTTLVAPGGATIVDFKVNYPGSYILVDHALSRVGKGLAGILEVTGERDVAVYEPVSPTQTVAHQH